MTELLSISAFRSERALTLAQMGELVGLSKSQMHEVERTGQASLRVAIEIERLSGGRIDAAALCEDVRRAREGVAVHAAGTTPDAAAPSTGQDGELSAVAAAAAGVAA